MAQAVGITPAELENVGRKDAADFIAVAPDGTLLVAEAKTLHHPDEIDLIYQSRTMTAREKLLRIRQVLQLRALAEQEADETAPAADAGAGVERESQSS